MREFNIRKELRQNLKNTYAQFGMITEKMRIQ